MKHHFYFFLAAFIVVANAVYWPINNIYKRNSVSAAENEASRILYREAEIVEHFCLNRYAPAPGRAAIPMEWEKALNSKIRLRDGVSEIVSEAAELQLRAEEIRNLAPGKVLLHVTLSKPSQYIIIRRPVALPNYLLFISKTSESFRDLTGNPLRFSPLALALVISAAAALILTLLRAVFPK